ncbi:MAG: hypothetical protein LBL63_03810 [Clostridiales Family XIII bacterium]|jgi:hypothetical protein|nr:hypothetical protein [Clostridiales Family XIII bacterium]
MKELFTLKTNGCVIAMKGFARGSAGARPVSRRMRGRIGVASAVVIAVLLASVSILAAVAPSAFAAAGDSGALKLEESYPQNKGEHMPVQNVGIKLFFNGDVTSERVQKNNSACFKLTDSKGKTVKTEAYYGTKQNNYILVTAVPKEGTLQPASEYTLTISETLMSSDDRTLDKDEIIKFSTVDTSGSTKVYMLLMVVMVAGMIAMTVISNRRKARAEAEAVMKEGKVNPYKMAKDKGITLQQALMIIEKDKEKRAKRLSAVTEAAKEKDAPEQKADAKRVKGSRPISAGGSAYRTGRKAVAERKAREEAAKRAKNAAAKSKKGKGKHKK